MRENSPEIFCIVVGGGPAPGINSVISSVTIAARNKGYNVYGVTGGIANTGCVDMVHELSIDTVSRIHYCGGSILCTSRVPPDNFEEVVEDMDRIKVSYLVMIGGDGTHYCASQLQKTAGDRLLVGHVPKTIDNDIALPGERSSFGFQTAREAGTEIVRILSMDASTTSRWYLTVTMGRKTGHLALGIGLAGGATLTLIPEEFPDLISLRNLAQIIVMSVEKRYKQGKPFGTVVLAEGLSERIDWSGVLNTEEVVKDPYGDIRFRDFNFDDFIKEEVQHQLAQKEINVPIVSKNIGYEFRCKPPNAFDIEYTRALGYGVVEKMLTEKASGTIVRHGGEFTMLPFADLIDPETGRTRIRYVDTNSLLYRVSREYMIR